MARRRTQAQIDSERAEVRGAAAATAAPVKGARARAADGRATDEDERPTRVAASEAGRRQSAAKSGPRGGRGRPSP
jgi:hypothetical protein